MIDLLDLLDPDPEAEDEEAGPEDQGDAEPTLGATVGIDQAEAWRATFSPHQDGEAEEDDPGEPSLGSPELALGWYATSQDHWAQGGRKDLEEDIGDQPEGEDTDREPSLGATCDPNQVWAWDPSSPLPCPTGEEEDDDPGEEDHRNYPRHLSQIGI